MHSICFFWILLFLASKWLATITLTACQFWMLFQLTPALHCDCIPSPYFVLILQFFFLIKQCFDSIWTKGLKTPIWEGIQYFCYWLVPRHCMSIAWSWLKYVLQRIDIEYTKMIHYSLFCLVMSWSIDHLPFEPQDFIIQFSFVHHQHMKILGISLASTTNLVKLFESK